MQASGTSDSGARDPVTGDPMVGDPVVGDPVIGDPVVGDLMAGGSRTGDAGTGNRGTGRGVGRPGGTASAHPEDFAPGVAPRDDPLTYPGALPSFSYLFTGAGIEPLGAVDDHGIGGGGLARRLGELGAAPMDRRQAVLAFGSNRSPAQLRSKFAAAAAIDPVVPVVRARLHGLSVVFAAYVARYGSIPATLVDDPGCVTEVAVTFLDEDQLALVDTTERGQRRPTLDPARHRVELLAGDELVGCQRYWSSRAALTLDGLPVRLGEVGSTGSGLGERTQREVQQLLLALWDGLVGAFADERAFVAAVRSPSVHRAANDALLGLEVSPAGRLGARGAGRHDDS